FLRRECVRAGIERDDVRPPAFGYQFGRGAGEEPPIRLLVPVAVAAHGGSVTLDGQMYCFRHQEGRAYVAVPRNHATYLLGFEPWRQENPTALGNGATT